MSSIIERKEPAADVVSHEITPVAVNTDPSGFARAGWLIVLFGFVGFLIWAFLAPLDKGVPMPGYVTKQSNRQAVQHLQGGTVRELLVRDGAVVKAGQVLVRLDNVTANAQFEITNVQYLSARGAEARLIAERDGAAKVTFPAELLDKQQDPRVADVIATQTQLFNSRQTSLRNELAAVDENIAGLKVQMQGLQESRDAKKQQIAILKEQLGGMRDLARDGYVARNRLLDLERTYAQLGGAMSEDIGNIGRTQRQIMELTLRRAQRLQDYQKEVRTALVEVQREADGQGARLVAQRQDLKNVEVRAPVSGTVVNLAVFTQGGVVGPGFKMMDIVPSEDPLVVEGQLAVNLVDKVHNGLPVQLTFSSVNSVHTPHVQGEIINVAADRTVDERTGQAHYVVRAKVTPEGMKEIEKVKLAIRPGMPVEMFVKTGERSMMSYLFKPLLDRAHTSLSEE
jgi:membrane fusion protein, protease secretion system